MATSGELTTIVATALGVPFETVREHLRNIRRKPGTITFSGYGRSAAAMTPRDAVRLLLAVAGSQFVKDSRATLDGFAKLQPLHYSTGRYTDRDDLPPPNLEGHLVRLMQRVIDGRQDLNAAFVRESKEGISQPLAFTLMSAATNRSGEAPRVAVARSFQRASGQGSLGGVTFGTPGWTEPVSSAPEYALAVRNSGLIQTRHVTTWAFAEIALAL